MKALRTAAFVVGAVALVATGVGAAGAAGLLGATVASGASIAGIATAAMLTSIGAIAGAASGVLSLITAATAPGGTLGGNATSFKIDKEAGIPVVIGRTYVGGNVVHRQDYDRPGSKLRRQAESWVTALSLGPVKSVGPLLIDKTNAVSFANGAAVGSYAGNMWLDTQLGACPEQRALAGPFGTFPGWSASSKLSGIAADLWTLDFDSKGEKFPNGVPQRGRIIEGVFSYDPRLDSTYPGGSGACRIDDPTTWVYSESPALNAITWAYGHHQNGVLMAGGGLAITGIDLQPFVEWANVCDAVGWKVGGLVYTESDDAWDVLKMICQAGAAEPMPVGAQLSVTFSAPRVSIGTITTDDLAGDVDRPAGVSKRLRRNTVVPKVRLESHGWDVTPLDPVIVADYVTIDGGRRPKEITYPLVQDAGQGAKLAAYDILNMREIDGIQLPCKVYMLGYRPGDQVDVDVPDARLVAQPVLIRNRDIAAASLTVTFSCRTETPGKHAFALGQTGTAPPTPSLGDPGVDRTAPDADDWSLAGASLTSGGGSVPAIVFTGTPGPLAASSIVFEYRSYVAGAGIDDGWLSAGVDLPTATRKEITSVTPGAQYEGSVRYSVRGVLSDRLLLGPATAGDLASGDTAAINQLIIANSYPLGVSIISSDDAGNAKVTISNHQRVYQDRTVDVTGATLTGLQNSTDYYLFYDDPDRAGGVVTIEATTTYGDAFTSSAYPARHYLGFVTSATTGGGDTGGGGATPPGGGGGRNPNTVIP
ncbi:hypothetical protein [uncultured Sphingomonas sp.]|uniref:hypothetical protein n=1 Tax=uncultured Sphingomonas sp. TaxID=158754 RepID=UPI0025EDCDD2|nr:hypothetical protein [uncultured Sphingomonas sp.]